MKKPTFRYATGRTKWLLCLLLTLAVSARAAEEAVESIGGRLELFVDAHLVSQLHGAARLRMHAPVRQEVALEHDEPWEGSGCGFHTVFRDGDTCRMYYKSWQILGSTQHPVMIAYAESRDGLDWVKPRLGLHEFQGSTDNNLVIKTIHGGPAHDFSVFRDANPHASADAKYKAVGVGKKPYGIYAFTSADGLHFQPSKQPIFTGGRIDSQNIPFFDSQLGKYRLYVRDVRAHAPSGRGLRSTRLALSDDFQTWTAAQPVTFPGSPGEELYTNNIQPYYRAPHIYLGFPARYVDRGWTESTRQLPEAEARAARSVRVPRYGTAVTDTLLMSSRDGKSFFRWPEAFLRPGLRTKNNWSYGDNFMAWGMLETPSRFDDAPAELSLYAVEGYFTGEHSRLRRYSLRIDGFASAFAPLEGGEVITRPVRFTGGQLVLNYSTSAGGGLHVELQSAAGEPLPGFELGACEEIFGDQLERVVTWNEKSDLTALAGQPIRLRFVLRDADVFSFQFR